LENKIAALRNMLWQMEVEVGLEKLPQPQKDVYYAACKGHPARPRVGSGHP
jgi:hypothetical protein